MVKRKTSSKTTTPKTPKSEPRKIVRDPVTHRRLHLPDLVR